MLAFTYTEIIHRLKPHFDAVRLSRGWDYYIHGAVERLDILGEGSILTAVVEGSDDYSVRIDLADASNSSCDCAYDDYCKHMVAVLLAAFKRAGLEPRQFLKANSALMEASKSTDSGRSTHPQTASSRTKKQAASEPQPSGLAADWQRYFEQQFEKYPAFSMQSIQDFVPKVNKKLLSFAITWSPTLKCLYELQVFLFAMKRADELHVLISRSYPHYAYQYREYFQDMSHIFLHRLGGIIDELDHEKATREYPELLEATAAYLGEHGFPVHGSIMPWVNVYSLLWSSLLRAPVWRQEERKRLERIYEENGTAQTIKDGVFASILLFDVLDGMDEKAIRRAEEVGIIKQAGLFFPFLHILSTSSEWERLVLWLKWLQPLIRTSTPLLMEPYLNYWEEAGKHCSLELEWKEMINSLPSSSFMYYAQFLLRHKRYREWADLYILHQRSPLTINKEILKLVEAEDIRLLLPLYHFAIERSIMEKNRVSYKMAVRLLKKLHQYYKRLKELERWERYIIHVSSQFSRYRAFQEELRKGKLIV